MLSLPTAPAPGTPVSSSLIRELIGAIRARTILRGKGYRTLETPNGTLLEFDVKAVAKSSASPDRSCFCIRPSPNQSDHGALAFCNCYVSDGMTFQKVCEDGDYRVDSFVLKGELEEGEEYTEADRPFVYLQYQQGAVAIDAQKDLEDVEDLAKDPTQGTVLLLYKLKHDGSVAVDFRNMPIFQHVEAI